MCIGERGWVENNIKILRTYNTGGYKEMSSFLADHAIVPSYKIPNAGGWGGGGGLRGLCQLVQLYTGAQINFGDLTPYLTYGTTSLALFIMRLQ